MEYTKEQLLKTKICPCCNRGGKPGKLKIVKKHGAFNLASEVMLECKTCYSNF